MFYLVLPFVNQIHYIAKGSRDAIGLNNCGAQLRGDHASVVIEWPLNNWGLLGGRRAKEPLEMVANAF